MSASTNNVANTNGKKTDVNNQLIENLKAELNRVKTDLKDERDKVNGDAERLRAFNVSHRYVLRGERLRPSTRDGAQLK